MYIFSCPLLAAYLDSKNTKESLFLWYLDEVWESLLERLAVLVLGVYGQSGRTLVREWSKSISSERSNLRRSSCGLQEGALADDALDVLGGLVLSQVSLPALNSPAPTRRRNIDSINPHRAYPADRDPAPEGLTQPHCIQRHPSEEANSQLSTATFHQPLRPWRCAHASMRPWLPIQKMSVILPMKKRDQQRICESKVETYSETDRRSDSAHGPVETESILTFPILTSGMYVYEQKGEDV
jgi:hypothetical protein